MIVFSLIDFKVTVALFRRWRVIAALVALSLAGCQASPRQAGRDESRPEEPRVASPAGPSRSLDAAWRDPETARNIAKSF